MTNNIEVAIIGAGPGGLTLARILKTKGIHATVYEREESNTARPQGGTLDIHVGSGQKALEAAGLLGQFKAVARKEGQDMRFVDKNNVICFDDIAAPDDESRPEIDRPVLRSILLNSVGSENIKWNHKLKGVSPLENGKHTLTFENGSTATTDVVVGADGAWSRVRSFLSPATPSYSGIIFVEGNIPSPSPATDKLVGAGTLIGLEENRGLFAQRNSGGNIRLYVALRVPEDWPTTCGIPFDDLPKAHAKLTELFPGWNPALTGMISECESFIPRPLYALPGKHTWETKGNVTLIGDAAHLMFPSGAGVNIAMQDALELATAIVANPTDLFKALQTYETGMSPRAQGEAKDSVAMKELFFAPTAPHSFVGYMQELMTKAAAAAAAAQTN